MYFKENYIMQTNINFVFIVRYTMMRKRHKKSIDSKVISIRAQGNLCLSMIRVAVEHAIVFLLQVMRAFVSLITQAKKHARELAK